MGADKSTEIPQMPQKFIGPRPKFWDFNEKRASLGVRSPWHQASLSLTRFEVTLKKFSSYVHIILLTPYKKFFYVEIVLWKKDFLRPPRSARSKNYTGNKQSYILLR